MIRFSIAHLDEGDDEALLARLAQQLGEDLDGLAFRQQEGHGHPRHARHLDVVEHIHQLVHQPLRQVRVLQGFDMDKVVQFTPGCCVQMVHLLLGATTWMTSADVQTHCRQTCGQAKSGSPFSFFLRTLAEAT